MANNKKVRTVLDNHGIKLDDIEDKIDQLAEFTEEQGAELTMNDQMIMCDLDDLDINLAEVKNDTVAIHAVLEDHGVQLNNITSKLDQLWNQNQKLDENDKKIISQLYKQAGFIFGEPKGLNLYTRKLQLLSACTEKCLSMNLNKPQVELGAVQK